MNNPKSNSTLSKSDEAAAAKAKSQEGFEPFNFFAMSLVYVLQRVGWIFKTESIIMPAVLDSIGGSAWLRGWLPMLNRFGQSIPPLLVSDRLRNQKQKRYTLAVAMLVMGGCFLALAAIWKLNDGQTSWWLPVVFLIVYAMFFSATGICQLAIGTLTGKLIVPHRRGRLMLVATMFGSTIAVLCAWYILRLWLAEPNGNFPKIFAFTGLTFVAAGGLSLLFREVDDVPSGKKRSVRALFMMSWMTLVYDKNFRLLTVIVALFSMSLTLFPHYQALGRARMEVSLVDLVPWVIAQNIGAGLFSIPTGWLGDRYGYRLVVRIVMFLICLPPILALVLSGLGTDGDGWFFFVFFLLGLTPITMRVFNNYALEIVEAKFHPRYLSTLSLCMAIPVVITSTLMGALIDWFSYEVVFLSVVSMVLLGWFLSGRLEEPRDKGPHRFEFASSKK